MRGKRRVRACEGRERVGACEGRETGRGMVHVREGSGE